MGFPQKFLARLSQMYPNTNNILKGFEQERFGSFRINSLVASSQEVLEEFFEKNIEIIPFIPIDGVYLFEKKFEYTIKGTQSFYGGKIYLQSLASLLPVLVLNPQKGEKILDICSAPGSKTTQIAMIQQNTGSIVALEKNQIRFDKLCYNIRLQKATSIHLEKIDARKFFRTKSEKFDKILLDAPCSSEGRFCIQNEKSYHFWSEENVAKKSQIQNELLEGSYEKLRDGGIMVYSTCTLAPEENEMIISDFLKNHNDMMIEEISLPLDEYDWYTKNIESFGEKNFKNLQKRAIRILPSKYTEGFFIAKLRKNEK